MPPPSPSPDASTRTGQRPGRSRTGCWTCRLKKVKCDEARPHCERCRRLRRLCSYGPLESESALVRSRRDANPGEMTLQLPAFGSSPSSVELTAADHEAIRYFRTTFARLNHTKNPDFSVYSIIFNIAEREPLVMHTLLALGSRGVETRRHQPPSRPDRTLGHRGWSHLSHYSSALKHLTAELAKDDHGSDAFNFDVCCTALYLMLVYEQNHGDADRHGLANHLNGAAMILRHRGKHIKAEVERQRLSLPSALSRRQSPTSFSLYSARILIWISLCDATASTYGVGGTFNEALHEVLGQWGPDAIEGLHTFSNPLFRTMWGSAYPQTELTDDIENRSVFELMVSCSQARYALSLLARSQDDVSRTYHIHRAKSTIQAIAVKYRELLEVADGLLPTTDNSHRLVANLRGVVPHYHAAVILFARLTGVAVSEFGRVEPDAHMASIMNLVRQGYRHQGYGALMRLSWPMLVVALETRRDQDRDWIMARFGSMASLNRNMEWAEEFLRNYVGGRGAAAPWTDPGTWFRSQDGNLFVI